MRISDWSSDVCSSDLLFAASKDGTKIPYFLARKAGATGPVPALIHAYGGFRAAQTPGYLTGQPYRAGPLGLFWVEDGNAYVLANNRGGGEYGRSEEHTSELQSLMRSSYAVFCLKTNKNKNTKLKNTKDT